MRLFGRFFKHCVIRWSTYLDRTIWSFFCSCFCFRVTSIATADLGIVMVIFSLVIRRWSVLRIIIVNAVVWNGIVVDQGTYHQKRIRFWLWISKKKNLLKIDFQKGEISKRRNELKIEFVNKKSWKFRKFYLAISTWVLSGFARLWFRPFSSRPNLS